MIEQSAERVPGWPWGPTAFERRVGNNLTRIVVAVVAIPLVLGAIWLGGHFFAILAAAISVGALLEFYRLAEAKGARPIRLVGVLVSLVSIVVAAYGKSLGPGLTYPLVLLLLLVAVITMTIRLFRAEGSALLDVSTTLAGTLYVSLGSVMLVLLRQTGGGENDRNGAYLLGCVMASIWICDSAAYFVGRAFGRHKLFERVSPKKSWEGAIAGAVAAVGAMIGLGGWAFPDMPIVHLGIIGAIVGVMGQIGDLAESHLKRDAGIKDSSQIIPGHGGLLDRFDSLLFVAPIVWVYVAIVSVQVGFGLPL